MAASQLSSRKRWITLAGIVAFVVLAAWMIMPAMRNSYEDFDVSYCIKCGKIKCFHQFVNTWSGKTEWQSETLEESPLSAWYEEHFGTYCEHHWRSYDAGREYWFYLFGRQLWRSGGNYTSGNWPPLIDLRDEDRREIDKLFQEDTRNCREYIQAELEGNYELAETLRSSHSARRKSE